jgi:hypothetical protein
MVNKCVWIYVFLFLTTSVFIGSCDEKKTNVQGFLKGTISIGPLCPVERIPPDPACSPTAETYKAYQVDVYSSDGVNKIAELNPSLDGSFIIELPSGNYKVDLEKRVKNIGGSNLPLEITVGNNDTILINIEIDTGIR